MALSTLFSLALAIPFLANSFPCRYCSLLIPFLDFLDESIPCKFTRMRIVGPFLEHSFPCKFNSLQIQRPQMDMRQFPWAHRAGYDVAMTSLPGPETLKSVNVILLVMQSSRRHQGRGLEEPRNQKLSLDKKS